mmetsp:Transcript_18721/g.47984  ORF Transcript_18721/g.47984 Transcript_18721/m.47984 type:complete len:628 (+) Transcript_18721:55-1938(+)|eukprot:jgi/Tetstr1/444822/TSEL_032664.t1
MDDDIKDDIKAAVARMMDRMTGQLVTPKQMQHRLFNIADPHSRTPNELEGMGPDDLCMCSCSLAMSSLASSWYYNMLNQALDIGVRPWKGSKWFYEARSPGRLPLEAPLRHFSEVGEDRAPGVVLKPGLLWEPSKKYEFENADGEQEDFLEQRSSMEMSPRHPGDCEADEAHVVGTVQTNPRFQPVVTKAAMGLYQIHFVTPGGEATGELVAAYPGQLCVRVDPVRKMLIYDACDFLPELITEFFPVTQRRAYDVCQAWKRLTSQLDHNRSPVPYLQEVLLHSHMLRKAQQARQHWDAPEPKNPSQRVKVPPGKHMMLYHKAMFCALCESSVHRVRFPLAAVVGLRLQRGKPPAAVDTHLTPPHVLILELRSPVPADGIATRKTNPENLEKGDFATCPDWTPGATASRATRHYIYGKPKELTELGLYLLEICPELKAMYNGPENTLQPRETGDPALAPYLRLAPSSAPPATASGADEPSRSAAGNSERSAEAVTTPSEWGVIPGLAGWQRWYEGLTSKRGFGGARNPNRTPLTHITEKQVWYIGQYVRSQGDVSMEPLLVMGMTMICDTLGLVAECLMDFYTSSDDDGDASMGSDNSGSDTDSSGESVWVTDSGGSEEEEEMGEEEM